MITKTMKATQVANHTIGNLYFSLLDHPGSRGPGFTVTPAPSSESRVQFGAIELTSASIEEQPEAFRLKSKLGETVIKKTLNWIHDCLYYLTTVYEWDLGKIDKEGFIPIRFLVYMPAKGRKNSSLKTAILIFFFQQGLCYHCASSLTIQETLNNGLQSLQSSGLCSSTRSILTLQKENAQCSMYISVRQTCNLWLGQCYLTSRMSLTYEARRGMSCDHSAEQYRKDGTTFNPLWSVGSMLRMIQEKLVSPQVIYHFVRDPDVHSSLESRGGAKAGVSSFGGPGGAWSFDTAGVGVVRPASSSGSCAGF